MTLYTNGVISMSLCAERSATVQYTFDDCFTAAVLAIDTLPKYSITESDFTTGSIDVNISASYNSYGERMIIEISDTGVACHVKITTSPKAPYLLWRGKCEKNNAEFFAALSKALQNFSTRAAGSTEPIVSTPSVEARLEKIKELLDANYITQEEYEQKRSDILSEL